jgi:hypothetical protein
MKKGTNIYASRAALWSCAVLATFAIGCGKKDSKKDDNTSAKPEAISTSMTEVSATEGQAKFRYSSNIKDAKFKCKLEIDGQAAEWQTCSADGISYSIPQGVPYKFSVKAIGPDGRESEVETYTGAASEAKTLELFAEIIGKEAIRGTIVDQPTLKVQFATKGQVNPAELRYECRRENEADFRRCPNGDEYDFGQLIDGSQYGLAVRAVHDATKSVSAEDSIQFTVQLSKLVVTGEEQLREQKTGSVNLSINQMPNAAKVVCKLNGSQEIDCSPINLDSLPTGSHSLDIAAIDAAGKEIASSSIKFCAKACEAQPMVQVFQIGSFYEYMIPQDMHVTQYATTKTFNNQLSFYRVMADSDPYYVGNYGCYQDFDRRISAASPSGKVYDYCHTTPQRDLYKWLTDFRLANNHIEVATNADEINPYNHERIMINVFDTDYEFMHDRSRFEQLCMNKRGTIQKTPPIRFMDRGFWGENVKAEFFMCVAELASSGPGLPQAGDEWWIGAFFISQDGLNYPMYECFRNDWRKIVHTCDGGCVEQIGYNPQFCGDFRNPSLLEVVYMTKTPYREAVDFARAAQAAFLRNLQEVVPLR